ncbi:MAG: hypothetical protein VKO44_09160 [Cyanobacteriota bacterium]|nr:hypothetical protein [Cyanobacteriota bacterium]
MRKPFTPEEKQRIRRRHHGYAVLLAVVAVAVLIQPLALNWPLLTSMNSIIMAMVMMLFLTRNSAVRAHKRWLYGLGTGAIVVEVIWLVGQFGVAMLIGLILGRFHQTARR